MIEYIVGNGLPPAPLPYSPATRVGNFVFVSGQGSTDETGKIVADTFEGEFHRTIKNLERILNAAGSDLTKLVQVKAYLREASRWDEYNVLYRQYFSEPFPARTTLTGCLPDTIQFEIDCIAVINEG